MMHDRERVRSLSVYMSVCVSVCLCVSVCACAPAMPANPLPPVLMDGRDLRTFISPLCRDSAVPRASHAMAALCHGCNAYSLLIPRYLAREAAGRLRSFLISDRMRVAKKERNVGMALLIGHVCGCQAEPVALEGAAARLEERADEGEASAVRERLDTRGM